MKKKIENCWQRAEFQQDRKAVGKLKERRNRPRKHDTEDHRRFSRWLEKGCGRSWTGRYVKNDGELPKEVHDEVKVYKTMMEEDSCGT